MNNNNPFGLTRYELWTLDGRFHASIAVQNNGTKLPHPEAPQSHPADEPLLDGCGRVLVEWMGNLFRVDPCATTVL